MHPHTLLFLAASPRTTDPRALDREARAIQLELERSGHRDCFELVTRWAVEPLDLLRELRVVRPTVVHFSGCGDAREPGLCFRGPDGEAQHVSATALVETFGAVEAPVKLVVLCTCYSEVQAAALVTQVDCVVGMAGSVDGDTARSFAIGLYGGLAEGESVAMAYRQGRAAVRLDGRGDHELPRLAVRPGVDPHRLVLAQAAPRLREPTAPSISASHGSVAAGSITHSSVIVGAPRARDDDDE